jgi:hypothetical protein
MTPPNVEEEFPNTPVQNSTNTGSSTVLPVRFREWQLRSG